MNNISKKAYRYMYMKWIKGVGSTIMHVLRTNCVTLRYVKKK